MYGFFAEFEAAPGKEEECAALFAEVKSMIDAEAGTKAWFTFRVGPSTFHIFDFFSTEEDREAHAQGEARRVIETRGMELFRRPPTVTPVDVIAAKLP